NPAAGHERESYDFEYSLVFTESGDWKDNSIHRMVHHQIVDSPVTVDSPDVRVTAVKPASRGDGIIIRLYAPFIPDEEIAVEAPSLGFGRAFLCDARERDLEALDVQGGRVCLKMKGNIATLRVLTG
ncbi:MAG: hypothetical protein KAH21_05395, partial [Spirochaetaceae bacterium]|nr:hypothetical protein [Spirochaetaceae bacterium]